MSEETKQVLIMTVAASVMLFLLIVAPLAYYKGVAQMAMENGYSQQSLPGNVGVYWVKDGKKLEDSNER